MASETERKNAAPDAAQSGPQLRLLDRRAFIGFPSLTLAPGVVVADFGLQIPDVTFPFNLTGGPARYQRKTLQFGFLELTVDAEVVRRQVRELSSRLMELEGLELFFRAGYLEAQARLKSAERTPVTFKVAFDGDGERLAVYLYDVRLYGSAATPAAQLPVLISRAVGELEALPELQLRGATGFTTRVLPVLCQAAAVSRGYKVPSLDQARLVAVEIAPAGLRLRFASGGLPPPSNPDEELLLALEGSRAFADAEALVAQGKLADAREAYLKLGDVQDAHPFAAERLLSLLVADPQAEELALDVAAALHRRRDRSATAMWAEAVVRARRGEAARAAERFLALCALARKNQEEASAFFAADAAVRAAADHAPQMAVKALHELLGIRPDHLPSLQLLARSSDQAQDRAGAIRAYRRIAALARDPAESAEAHVQLARLCAETEDDVAGARLHCEAALKLAPDHPDALLQLGALCHRAGEHLRGLKALDRLREVAMARHEIDRVGRASLLAGQIWEDGLEQLENALLRYREAVSLLPASPEAHFDLGRVAEKLGKLQEALSGYQQCIELAGPAPADAKIRKAAHQAHHALARLARTRLADPTRAREHLEAALALDPRDTIALEELVPYFRATGRAAELAEACQKAAVATEDPIRRAAFWAEAGELYRGRLGDADKADRLLNAAIDADPKNRTALEGLLALAEARRDGGQLCRVLKALAELTTEPKERARLFRRLAVAARDLAFDLELATFALREVLQIEPEDLSALGELCGLHRKRADMNGLAAALEQRGRIAEAHGDRRLASAALREMAQVLELRLGRVGEALVALEKAARLAPDHGVLLELADLALRCEQPDHARRALEELLKQLPPGASPDREAEIRSRLGRACELSGDRDGARAHYAMAFPLRRLDDALATRLEALYQDAGEFRELGELWADRAEALVDAGRSESAAPLYLKSGRALVDLGEPGAALVRLTRALELAPNGAHAAEILELMAELELGRGGKLEAAKLLARRAAMLPRGREAARLFHRAATLSTGTPTELAYLGDAIDQDPVFAPARVRRAELLHADQPASALADLEVALGAIEGDPDAPTGEDRLRLARRTAIAARRAQRPDVARKHLATYCAEHPEDLEAQQELAALLRQAGQDEALCDLLSVLWRRLSGDAQREALREHAELAISLSRTHAALEALRSILHRDPEDLWAVRALLGLLPDSSATAAEEAERLQLFGVLIGQADREEKADLYARRGAIHLAAERWEEARADCLAAAELSPRPRAHFEKAAHASQQLGDERGELSAWRGALQREPAMAAELRTRLLQLAHAREVAKDPASARLAYEAALTGEPDDTLRSEVELGVARVALLQNDRKGAAAALRAASARGPQDRRLEAALALADLHESAGELPDAVTALEQALELSPNLARAQERLVRIVRTLGDWGSLAELLAAQVAHAPRAQAIPLLEELAELYADRLDEPGPAEAALRKLVALEPNHLEAQGKLARLLLARGEYEDAAKRLEEAAAANGEGAVSLLWDGAEAATEHGRDDLALKLARRAHQLAPAKADRALLLGRLLYRAGAAAEALPVFRALTREFTFETDGELAEEIRLTLITLTADGEDRAFAERMAREILSVRPHSIAAADRLAELLQPRNPREAIQVLIDNAFALTAPQVATERLTWLARRAEEELADVELAASCLRRAAELSTEPLAVRRSLAELFRRAGRTQELHAELDRLADLSIAAEDPYAAIEALEELATLAEEIGRIDAALATLSRAGAMWEQQGARSSAAAIERRRAELLRDAKLDLDAADASLERAFGLLAELETAQMGVQLAQRREDADGQARWLSRAAELTTDAGARAALLVDLARVEDAHRGNPEASERAAREALRLSPEVPGAEALLVRLLERQGRVGELAAFYEEAAGRSREPKTRAALFRRAAELYRTRAGDKAAAATALLAARAANPDDLTLTAAAASLLHELGRDDEAAEFDAQLLLSDPLRADVFGRHLAYLEGRGDLKGQAELFVHRAQRQDAVAASRSFLEAAARLKQAGVAARAAECEDLAFEADPSNDAAFAQVRARAGHDVRQLADVLAARAAAVDPERRVLLLRERADLLLEAGEELLAASAFDALLAEVGEDVPALLARADLAARAGGPVAAQPYDRRALSAAGNALPLPVRLKTQLRIGSASLAKGALRDAADAFESVVSVDPEGPKGREALSLLSEVYARTQDTRGLYRTSLLLAKGAEPTEADALLRRAASLYEAPEEAIDALLPLAQRHPGEPDVIDRAAEGLRALLRHDELIALYERGAEAVGGSRAAELLLAAAQVAGEALGDPARAEALTARAATRDPSNVAALRAVVAQQRAKGEHEALLTTLDRLIDAVGDSEEGSALRVELAELALAEGQTQRAREAYEGVLARGPKTSGYREAVEGLARLLSDAGDSAALGRVLSARAELAAGRERADFLLLSARSLQRSGELETAAEKVREAVELAPSVEALVLLATLCRGLEELPGAAEALVRAAELSPAEARGPFLIEASEARAAGGDTAAAAELLERAAAAAPSLLPPQTLADKLLALGEKERAAAVGFAPALLEGRLFHALTLAEAAGDAAKVRRALWAMLERGGEDALPAQTLIARLREDASAEEQVRLARACAATTPEVATSLYLDVAGNGGFTDSLRAEAVDRLAELAGPEVLAARLLPVLRPDADGALIDRVLTLLRAAPAEARGALLEAAGHALPGLRPALLRERYEQARAAGDDAAAADVLAERITLEEDRLARAALRAELGELRWRGLDDAERARTEFEAALADDEANLAAIRALVELHRADEPEPFLAMAERLERLGGEDAVAPHREAMAGAYEAVGRREDAYRLLSALPQTPERLRRRATLAGALGLAGESLQLREKLTDDPVELEQILYGYVEAELVPFAVRLAERLELSRLTAHTRRFVAERLSSTEQGAPLAASLWPELLRAGPADADGWTLFGEALRGAGRTAAAELVDGLGAALTSSETAAPTPTLHPLARPEGETFPVEPEGKRVPITELTMPRLHAALAPVLAAVGAPEVLLSLDPTGGVEAYLATPEELVIGAGALSVFAPAELSYLAALALALGARGQQLRQAGVLPDGFAEAAAAAIGAVPGLLAAGRVLAHLDPSVRGTDPLKVDVGPVLGRSPALAAVVAAVLTAVFPAVLPRVTGQV